MGRIIGCFLQSLKSESESHSVMSDFLPPHGLYTVHEILQARILEWVAFPFSRGSSQPRDKTQVSHTAGGFFLPAEPQGKPKNTGVGSLFRLQGIFPDPGIEPGYPALQADSLSSYQGSPDTVLWRSQNPTIVLQLQISKKKEDLSHKWTGFPNFPSIHL